MRCPSPPTETAAPILLLGTRHPLTSATDLAKKQYHWKKFGNQNIQMVELAQALKAAGDTKVTVEIGPQDHESFTPSEVVTVTP